MDPERAVQLAPFAFSCCAAQPNQEVFHYLSCCLQKSETEGRGSLRLAQDPRPMRLATCCSLSVNFGLATEDSNRKRLTRASFVANAAREFSLRKTSTKQTVYELQQIK